MELKEFDAVFPEILKVLTTEGFGPECQDATDWYKEVLEYTVPNGKRNLGLAVVRAFQHFASEKSLTNDNLHLAAVLGWCVEMLQATFLICDDIVDQSEMRRGKLCWYKNEHVGYQAMNDIISVSSGIYVLLKKYFKGKKYYVNLVEMFMMASKGTMTGQTLDTLSGKQERKIYFDNFTRSRMETVTKYKTALYTFFLPVGVGMYMAGYTEEKVEKTKPVLVSLGQLYQAQDEYLDCYGISEVTGKVGTDIEEGKCSWMIVTALELASVQQKKILMENYGKPDKAKVAKVKAVYDELDLSKVYEEYETTSYKKILTMIQQLRNDIPGKPFNEMLTKMYKRNK